MPLGKSELENEQDTLKQREALERRRRELKKLEEKKKEIKGKLGQQLVPQPNTPQLKQELAKVEEELEKYADLRQQETKAQPRPGESSSYKQKEDGLAQREQLEKRRFELKNLQQKQKELRGKLGQQGLMPTPDAPRLKQELEKIEQQIKEKYGDLLPSAQGQTQPRQEETGEHRKEQNSLKQREILEGLRDRQKQLVQKQKELKGKLNQCQYVPADTSAVKEQLQKVENELQALVQKIESIKL